MLTDKSIPQDPFVVISMEITTGLWSGADRPPPS